MSGAPTSYKEEYNEQAYKLALLGCTDLEIAEFFEVNPDTIHEWKKVYPLFSESIKNGKTPADSIVAKSLHERAIGAEWEEERAIKVKRGKDLEEVVIVKVKCKAPPDTNAASLWLRNRRPKSNKGSLSWNEKAITEISGKDGEPIDTRDLTSEILKHIPPEVLEAILNKKAE